MIDEKNKIDINCSLVESDIPEDPSRLVMLGLGALDVSVKKIVSSLKEDYVVLVRHLDDVEADNLMLSVCEKLGIRGSLEVQSTFASSLGHRQNVGKYYMSVNRRGEYQFVAPHSEGGSFTNLQLASFYCYENSTDGGETILMNVDQSSNVWGNLRERVRRGKATRALTSAEVRKLKVVARLSMPEDSIKDSDEVLSQNEISPHFTVYDVLAKPTNSYSKLLERDVYSYWDTIESVDCDSAIEFEYFLRQHGLLMLPSGGLDSKDLDDSVDRRIRSFGSRYNDIFKCRLTRKLQPGEFIIQNNMTWCHSVSNWTPGSGVRKVVAAFA